MQWLNRLVGSALASLGLDPASLAMKILQFFVYDVIKIFILLGVLIFTVSYIQSYFPPERSRRILSRFKGLGANTISALLGTLTPFCACSSIPLFIGFTTAGLPVGVTFSFLISSPLVDLGSLVLLTSIFGLKTAVAYVVIGLVLAIVGGTLIEKLHLDDQIEDFVRNLPPVIGEAGELTQTERLQYAWDQTKDTIRRVALYIFIGVGIGALIHNVIPADWIQNILGKQWYAVPLATLIGVPMYADIFGTIPVAESLFLKGAGLGTVLSFMMAVTALSLPSLIMLRKVVKPKLLAIFFIIVTVGIILIGYLFNIFQPFFT